MKGLYILLTLAALCACYGQGSRLFQADDPRFGAGALTVDARTSLTWLDVPFSAGRSMVDMWEAFEPGGKFYGFRWATPAEVASLFQTAGVTREYSPPGTPAFANAERLLALVGTTTETYGKAGVLGLAADKLESLYYLGDFVGYLNTTAGGGDTFWGITTKDAGVGHWLVVPEPSTLALLCFGGMLLASPAVASIFTK
jgi:hypothetical protein